MSAESTFSFTTKINGDLFTVRGDTFDDFRAHLSNAVADLPGLIEDIAQVQAAGHAAPVVNVSVPPTPVAATPQAAPAYKPATPAPAGDAPVCEHGQPMRFVAPGISKNTGKPYSGFWSCAQPRGQQCNTKVSTR